MNVKNRTNDIDQQCQFDTVVGQDSDLDVSAYAAWNRCAIRFYAR